MSKPDFREAVQETVVVVLDDGRPAIRTSTRRGMAGKGPVGDQIEYLAFDDPVEGLRIARDLAVVCMEKIGKNAGEGHDV